MQGGVFCEYQPIGLGRCLPTQWLIIIADLSFWYPYSELATRGAIFFSMSTIAGAFNGLISYGISKDLDGANGWRAWRWIFLIEGIMPCVFSFVVLLLLPISPRRIRFGFNAWERERIIQRSLEAHNTAEARLEVKKVPLILLSLPFWLFTIIACCSHFATTSLFNFLPDIVRVGKRLIHVTGLRVYQAI